MVSSDWQRLCAIATLLSLLSVISKPDSLAAVLPIPGVSLEALKLFVAAETRRNHDVH
jgi:hypothetical protein